ncbi:prepilin peptidase [Sphingomonas sp. AR_OL41]|jgi:prepilin peptidase CpaA|uniref:A24 family peptidase n=1 Tax=Sphingomonas sp. AR_OL41 TaxID=3042729 RepID=UPI002480D13C|nr:prepilin peptidase [Sphingomonas sp. AR_OL41]MDH7971664.1 prepilin peptidase [Sphingomonas sp. AR_OL41]
MGGFNLNIALLAALVLLLVSAGIQDARTREIANWKNAAILALAPLWWWSNGLALMPDIAIQLALGGVVFALFCVAFYCNWMGGGDVKMIGALALWLPFEALAWMLIVMSLLGGVLTLILVVERRVLRKEGVPEIPYGVAIAIAGLFAIREPLINHLS